MASDDAGEMTNVVGALAPPERRWTMTLERIACVCPECRMTYRVPAKARGHHARCRACGKTFRVGEKVSRPATDDDVLRWLREAEDRDKVAVERREVSVV